MKIIVAKNIGFCFGVKRAVDMAYNAKKQFGKVFTLGEIIHNKFVVDKLCDDGIKMVESEKELSKGATVLIRSHGAAPEVFDYLHNSSINVIDATCPFVMKIQTIVNEAFQKGSEIIIVGQRDHPEVIGINGQCSFSATVIDSINAVKDVTISADKKVTIVSQTTFSRELFDIILKELLQKYPNATFHSTICNTTRSRQEEAERLSRECTKMIVIGGKNSSNTKKLSDICKKSCKSVFLVEKNIELPLEKIEKDDIIGVVAGASTPDWIIREVLTRMNELEKTANTEEVKEAVTTEKKEAAKTASAKNASAKAGEKTAKADKADESFAEAFESTLVRIKNGQVLEGTVVSVTDENIWVSIGYKSDGYVTKSEYSNDPDVVLTEAVAPGDTIKVEVLKVNDGTGNVLLSRRSIEKKALMEAMFNDDDMVGKVMEAYIKEAVKGGLVASINGMRTFIPASMASLRFSDDTKAFVGKTMNVQIVEVDKQKKSIIASLKAILEQQRTEQLKEICEKLVVGSKVTGTVKRFTKFGYFVDIGGIDGLIRISDLVWGHTDNPGEVLKEGQEVMVLVLAVDVEKSHVSLGYRQLQPKPDPWLAAAERFPVGSIVEGKVVRILPFGAFVQITPSIDALIHISQVGVRRIAKIEDEINLNDVVRCKVLEVNPEAKRMNLSRRDLILEENPELAAEIAREAEERERLREERAAQRAAYEQQRKERAEKSEQHTSAAPEERRRRESSPAASNNGEQSEQRYERRPRREENDFQLPPVEQATTSLAGLLSGFSSDNSDEN